MRLLLVILIICNSILLFGTEQTPDVLIYKSDTIYIDKFPLEVLSQKNTTIANRLVDTSCLSTDCWRQYIAIWKIENDSLFLIGLEDCCNYKKIPLRKVFDESQIQNGKIFANWFSENLKAGFGKWIQFDEENLENIYDKNIDLEIVDGIIKKCLIRKTNKEN